MSGIPKYLEIVAGDGDTCADCGESMYSSIDCLESEDGQHYSRAQSKVDRVFLLGWNDSVKSRRPTGRAANAV